MVPESTGKNTVWYWSGPVDGFTPPEDGQLIPADRNPVAAVGTEAYTSAMTRYQPGCCAT
jgi:hypothetical protein